MQSSKQLILMLSTLLFSLLLSHALSHTAHAATYAQLRAKYPPNNLRLGIDAFAWSQQKSNLSLGFRREGEVVSLTWQQADFKKENADISHRRIGIQLKRYFQSTWWVAAIDLNHNLVSAKNELGSDEVGGWEVTPKIGYRKFIEDSFWIDAMVGFSIKVTHHPVKPETKGYLCGGRDDRGEIDNRCPEPIESEATNTPIVVFSIELTYELPIFN